MVEGKPSEPEPTDLEHPRALLVALLVLSFVTGIVDAASYLGLGRVFTANMTGNVALLGFALAAAPGLSATRSLLSLGGFLVGAVLGGRLARALESRRRTWLALASGSEFALILTAALLALGAGSEAQGTRRTVLILLLGVAMGIRNATVRWLEVADLTTTVLTQMLTRLASDSRLAGGTGVRSPRRLMGAVAIALGALAGALMQKHSVTGPLLLAAGLVLLTQGAYLVYTRFAP